MTRILPLLLLITLCCPAQAGVYKRTDAEGNVEYSDLPQTTKEKAIPLPPTTTYKPTPVDSTSHAADTGQVQTGAYESVTITQPTDEEAVRENTGKLTVQISSTPPLQSGHRFVVLIDGKKMAEGQGTRQQVDNLDRGTHNVQVQVVDASGQVISSSRRVTFYMQRISILQQQAPADSPYTMPAPYRSPSPYQLPAPYRNAP